MDETARVELCNRLLAEITAPWVRELGLRAVHASEREVELDAPVSSALVHGGGVVCGQALMAMADTAMVLALSSSLGEFRPMTTVQLQTSFLKPVPGTAQSVRIRATVLRRGKSLAFGEIAMLSPDGSLAAHATTTYALL
ncbi:MAG: PaaI family thioesterase [Rubrivivax sp.]|jgi:uncharacterized protein (TIGR00369 family)